MRNRVATAAIRQLAEKQHGVVAHRQVLELGEGKGLAWRRREGGLLISLHRGVYALGHQRLTREGRWMAAVLACGPGAVLSHFSGGHLWSLCGSHGPVEVLRRAGGAKGEGHRGVWLHQTRRLEPFEVAVERGIPVVTIERVLLDVAARTDAKQLERILVQADKTGRLSWPRLERVIERGRGRKGIGELRRIAQEVDPQALETRSVTEIDFLALCREANLSTPSVNVLVEDHLVDFLWPAQKVIVETDSWSHHGDRPTFERDHQTDVDLIAAGYDVHRTTYKMLEQNPGPFLHNVRRALRIRTASTSLSAGWRS
jgi:very-short-patch-repair endonuclease